MNRKCVFNVGCDNSIVLSNFHFMYSERKRKHKAMYWATNWRNRMIRIQEKVIRITPYLSVFMSRPLEAWKVYTFFGGFSARLNALLLYFKEFRKCQWKDKVRQFQATVQISKKVIMWLTFLEPSTRTLPGDIEHLCTRYLGSKRINSSHILM